MDNQRKQPVIFVSSTCYDLKQVREDLKNFFESNYGFNALLSEFDSFPIDPCVGTFENCLNNVDKCADIFVLIIGTRYGYVTNNGKSITNLEYLHAKAKGIPVFVFVNKQLSDNLHLWRKNKNGDFSSIVENPQVFEFVAEIYDESWQWVFTYETVQDIMMTMKNQLRLIISDGLIYKRIINTPQYSVLNSDISADAARALIEKPFAWEYRFLAHILRNEFQKLQRRRWDFKYGVFEGHTMAYEEPELFNDIKKKLDEMIKLIEILNVLVNTAFQDAMGAPGTPADLEMIIYVSKQLASLYERLICWALYFKSLHVDEKYTQLLHLLYELPAYALNRIDDFVERLYGEITNLPEANDNVKRHVQLTCEIEFTNLDEITIEMAKVFNLPIPDIE